MILNGNSVVPKFGEESVEGLKSQKLVLFELIDKKSKVTLRITRSKISHIGQLRGEI